MSNCKRKKKKRDRPVHVLSPGARLFDIGGALLIAGDMFSLEKDWK